MSERTPNKQGAAELRGRRFMESIFHREAGGHSPRPRPQPGCKMGQFFPVPLQHCSSAGIAGAGSCPRGLIPEPQGSEAAAALRTSCLSREDRFRLVRGLWEIQLGDFSPEPRLCPGRQEERVRSCPAGSRYTNPKTGRFKSGDATQYSVLFVCL